MTAPTPRPRVTPAPHPVRRADAGAAHLIWSPSMLLSVNKVVDEAPTSTARADKEKESGKGQAGPPSCSPTDAPSPAPPKFIPLTRGLVATVDAKDHEWLSQYNWYVHESNGGRVYACMRVRTHRGRDRGRKTLWMHRIITQSPPGLTVDHINGDRLDNRRSNLRVCTMAENARNTRGWRTRKIPFKGLRINHGRYDVRFRLGSWRVAARMVCLGRSKDAVIAALIYDALARLLYGAFAHENFPLKSSLRGQVPLGKFQEGP